MTYKELLTITRKNPGCLWTREQREIHSNYKFEHWLSQNASSAGKDSKKAQEEVQEAVQEEDMEK